MKNKIRTFLCFLLILIGLLQIIGHTTGFKAIKGLGAITTASPLPLVFTAVKGIETYASEFYLEVETSDGKKKSLKVTPEIYSKFKGPYNRRNIYGATFAYGPLLPDTLRNTILKNAFCGPFFLKEDLEISENIRQTTLHINAPSIERHWVYKIRCSNE